MSADAASPAAGAVPAREGPAATATGRGTELSGWGRAVRVRAVERLSEDLEAITRDVPLTRGLGRSYGDASLPAAEGVQVAGSRLADRILAFDRDTGRLRAEAGLSLAGMNRATLAERWFTPVTPGTQHVTLGGMVAADVHGKNHHVAGSFGAHVDALRMRLADGRLVECGPGRHDDLFRATVGGFGLTGHVLEVELRLERLPSSWIWQRIERAPSLEPLLERLRASGSEWPFTVSWVDCFARGASFGRGVLILGRWARPDEAPAGHPPPRRVAGVPVEIPEFALNRVTGALFNKLYAWKQRSGEGLVHPEAFFYPLDVVRDWNRGYGRSGFIQYQCVLPHDEANRATVGLMRRAAELGADSFLCVVKDFGGEGPGTISFPRPGMTVSLDIAYRGEATRRLVDGLDAFVAERGGRIYLAKDALTRAETFRAMEPRLAAWEEVRARWDPGERLASALSRRLRLGPSR